METIIDFPGGTNVDTDFGPYTISTDQPPPWDLRGISTDVVRIVQRNHPNLVTGLVEKIDLKIQVASSFPKE